MKELEKTIYIISKADEFYLKNGFVYYNTAQKNQSFQIDLIINVTLVRRFYLMERITYKLRTKFSF